MRKELKYISVVVAALSGGVAYATPVEVLLGSDSDLDFLEPGDSFTVAVGIIGLFSGETIDDLGVAVEYDSTLLSLPSSVGVPPASIVPDAFNFSSLVFDGPSIDAPFLDEGRISVEGFFVDAGDPITLPGVFFTFDVTVLNDAPADSISSFNVSAFSVRGTDFLGDTFEESIASPSNLGAFLPYRVVPEPTSAVLLAGLGALVVRRRRH